MKKSFIALSLFLVPLFAALEAPSQAADMTAMEVVKKANHAMFYQGGDQKARVDMRIIDKQGRERIRQLTLLRRNFDDVDGQQKYYAYFSKPSDVNKMVFMAAKNIGKDDDRWLYLPALDLVKRIAASDDRTSFVGSDFFYEDVSGREINEDTHRFVGENDDVFIIESTPKIPGDVEFNHYRNWVDKETFLPLKAEYYDDKGLVYRAYEALKIEDIDGFSTVIDAVMENRVTGGKTLLHYFDISYGIGLPEKIFSERYLRKAPRKYVR
ncbi:MAG: outer membrane lipoprotein-sorting protein [Kordiimonadaceae bacterium]|nr:outer membrane lipoprotein-sorting protein [Kordiimonadaceae bacterium]